MIRWPLFMIGLGLIVCALIARLQQPPLSADARRVTLSEAIALASGSAKQFIEIEATVDTGRRIYSNGGAVSKPLYTANPTDRVYSIQLEDLQSAAVEKFLGNLVRVEAGTDSHYLRLQTIRDRVLEKDQLLHERLLAPVQGSALQLWALSEVFSGEDPKAQAWLGQKQLQGNLTRLKDLESNRSYPKFSHDVHAILQAAEKEFGHPVSDGAYLLLTDGNVQPQAAPSFYCPIIDSQETLFFVLTPSLATNIRTALRGVLEPSRLELYSDFEHALGKKLPARIGIIRPETGESANRRTAANLRDVFTLGAVLAALGLIGILWKRRRPG